MSQEHLKNLRSLKWMPVLGLRLRGCGQFRRGLGEVSRVLIGPPGSGCQQELAFFPTLTELTAQFINSGTGGECCIAALLCANDGGGDKTFHVYLPSDKL